MTQNKEILNWLRANNIYHNWVSKTKLREFFSKNIKFEGLSLWWITRLVDKDNVIENSWHNDFKKIVDGKKIKNQNFFWILFISKLIKNFFKNLFNLLYYKSFALIFSKKIRPGQYENCFHSIDYNFQNYKREFSDRLYGLAPSKNKKKNFYLISASEKKLKIFTKKIEPEAFVANSYLSFYEFIKIYLNVIYNLFLTLKFLNKNKNLFFIKKINYKNVLKPLIINSFSGSIQNSLIQALSIRNFLQKSKIKNFICYGEFNPGYRSIYFFTKKLDYPVNITTIHHGYANENLLFFFHKKDEFNLNYKQGEMSSPMPDQYLVQGIQYKKILKKYYPKKTKIIGCLKYDITKFKAPIKKNKNKYKKKILIAPSIGDEKDILNYLIYFVKNNRSLVKNFKFYLSPHPVNKLKTINDFKKNLSTIEINTSNKSTQEIMQFCDLVLCGFSTVAYEASIMGIPAMRLVNPNSPILFHLKDDIKKIYDQKVFEKELKRKKYNKIKRNKIIKYFFYKIDGMTYKRFWKELK